GATGRAAAAGLLVPAGGHVPVLAGRPGAGPRTVAAPGLPHPRPGRGERRRRLRPHRGRLRPPELRDLPCPDHRGRLPNGRRPPRKSGYCSRSLMSEPLVFNPFAPGFAEDPYPHYAELREGDPVHEHPMGIWFLWRWAD